MKEIICITGPLLSYSSKTEAKRALEIAGYEVKSSVTKSVTLLVNETGINSSKSKKAASAGVPTIDNLEDLIKSNKDSLLTLAIKKLRAKKLKSEKALYEDIKKSDKKLYDFLKVIKPNDSLHVITSGIFLGTNKSGFYSKVRHLFLTQLEFKEITFNGNRWSDQPTEVFNINEYLTSLDKVSKSVSKLLKKKYLIVFCGKNPDFHELGKQLGKQSMPLVEAEKIFQKKESSAKKGDKKSFPLPLTNYEAAIIVHPEKVSNLLGLIKPPAEYKAKYFDINCRAKKHDGKKRPDIYGYKSKLVYKDSKGWWGINHSPLDCYFSGRLPDYRFDIEKRLDHSFFTTNRVACLAIDLTQALIPLVTNLNPNGLPDFSYSAMSLLTDQLYSFDDLDPWNSRNFWFYGHDLGYLLKDNATNPKVNIRYVLQLDLLYRFSVLAASLDNGPSLHALARRGQDFLNFFKDNRKTKIYDKALRRFQSILNLFYIHPDNRISFSNAPKKTSTESPSNRKLLRQNMKIIAEVLVDHWLYNHPFFIDIEGNYLDKAKFKKIIGSNFGIPGSKNKLSYESQLVDVFFKDDLLRLAKIVEFKERQIL